MQPNKSFFVKFGQIRQIRHRGLVKIAYICIRVPVSFYADSIRQAADAGIDMAFSHYSDLHITVNINLILH